MVILGDHVDSIPPIVLLDINDLDDPDNLCILRDQCFGGEQLSTVIPAIPKRRPHIHSGVHAAA